MRREDVTMRWEDLKRCRRCGIVGVGDCPTQGGGSPPCQARVYVQGEDQDAFLAANGWSYMDAQALRPSDTRLLTDRQITRAVVRAMIGGRP